ncbi:DMT family transporter [Streptomyces sp. YGL11-2]|uniref:DMT family transporter n=1 Tax=Streptomyces sp. YGL11-2 TaxID=3414028 RepID=UPI003CE6C507
MDVTTRPRRQGDPLPAESATGQRGGKARRIRLLAIYLFVCAVWGTTWYGMKVSVESIPPITAAGLRFVIACPFLAIAVALSPSASFRFPRGKRWLFPFVSVVYIAVPYALINYGEQHISSGFASLLFASVTVFLLVFSRIISGTRVAGRQWLGILLGLACLVVLILDTGGDLSTENLLAPGAVLIAAVLHAFTYAMLARHAGDINVLTVEVLPIGMGGVLLLGLGAAVEHPDFGAVTAQSWMGVVYLAVVASVVGFAAYFYLLKHMNPVSLSFVFVFFPVIAVFVSSLLEHSELGPVALVSAAAMLGSFALTKKRDTAEATDAAPKQEVAL